MIWRNNVDGSRRALFSECGRYRYALLLDWNKGGKVLASVGLNPSTADEFKNDPTIARDVERAAAIGFGALLKLNLFPFRSTDPAGMKKARDPYGEWKDPLKMIDLALELRAVMFIACWGNHGTHRDRAQEFREACLERNIELWAYATNKGGEPTHPLYLAYSLQPGKYNWQSERATA